MLSDFYKNTTMTIILLRFYHIMNNSYKLLRNKPAIIELSDGWIRFTTTDGVTVEFVADNKRTLRIKKNCGNHGVFRIAGNSVRSGKNLL